MRKRWTVLLSALLLAGCVWGCGREGGQEASSGRAGKLPSFAEILEEGTRTWRYADDLSLLRRIDGPEWTAAGYDDADWNTASGTFGARDGGLEELSDGSLPAVCLRQYLPSGETIPAYYFRLSFTADENMDVNSPLTADILYDDAVIIYLNGEVIGSANVPEEGYPKPHSYGCEQVCDGPEKTTLTLDPSLLREGENVLAVELHQDNESSSDIYFEMGDLGNERTRQAAMRNDTMHLGAGSDESEVLVTWQGPICEEARVEVAEGTDPGMPEDAGIYAAEAVYPDTDSDTCTYRAVIGGLNPGDYVYRVVDQGESDVCRFHIAERDGRYSFLCHGDPQIRSAKEADDRMAYESLAAYVMEGESPDFVLSLGDQSDDRNDPELFRHYLSFPLLKSVPLAVVVGNHEREDVMFSRFFALPNMDEGTTGSSGDMSGDYWFFRGNTLFCCLNSNNHDTEAHAEFLEEARNACVKRYGEPVWIVAALHHSFFSAGQHADDEDITEGRSAYAAMFEEAGVDVVFSGHDHIYTRSKPMKGEEPSGDAEEGIVYFTLGSSTGTKYYDLLEREPGYVACADGTHHPAMTRVDVTEEEIKVTTYMDAGEEIKVVDAYTIEKD